MTTFTNIDVRTSPEDAAQQIYLAIQQRWPDWEPSDANLEVWLADAFARLASETAILASSTTNAIFRSFGLKILGVPPIYASPARGALTIRFLDTEGYTIPAGTEFSLQRSGSDRYRFRSVNEVSVAPGDNLTDPGEIQIEALISGTDANGLLPSTAAPALLSALDLPIDTITLLAKTTGGEEEETEEEYANRLVGEIQLLAPTPILPRDFTRFVMRHPSVYRAVTIDLWNRAEPGTVNNERMVGTVAIDDTGEDITPADKTEIVADINARREVNFNFGMGSPTYTIIFVNATVVAFAEFSLATVEADCEQALKDYLSPARWGLLPYGDSEKTWLNSTVVRRNELISVLDRVNGVNYVTACTLGTATNPSGTTDITLAGRVPLTRPATTGTGMNVTAGY